MNILTLVIHPLKIIVPAMKSAHKPFIAVVVLSLIILYGLMAIIGS